MCIKQLKKISSQQLLWGLILICAIVLTMAYVMEHYFGILACKMCHYERNTFLAGGGIAMLCLFLPQPFQRHGILILGLIFMIGTLLAGYHVAIQNHWVDLPTFCASNDFSAFESVEALCEQLLQTPFVRCDQITWSLFGLSLAAYNALLSLLLTLLCWGWGLKRK